MAIIFTNHSKERMRLRQMAQSDIELVLRKPDKTYPGKKHGTTKFVKEVNGRNHQVVAKLLENDQDWLVLSVWVRGEEDHNWITSVSNLIWNVLKGTIKQILRVFR